MSIPEKYVHPVGVSAEETMRSVIGCGAGSTRLLDALDHRQWYLDVLNDDCSRWGQKLLDTRRSGKRIKKKAGYPAQFT